MVVGPCFGLWKMIAMLGELFPAILRILGRRKIFGHINLSISFIHFALDPSNYTPDNYRVNNMKVSKYLSGALLHPYVLQNSYKRW